MYVSVGRGQAVSGSWAVWARALVRINPFPPTENGVHLARRSSRPSVAPRAHVGLRHATPLGGAVEYDHRTEPRERCWPASDPRHRCIRRRSHGGRSRLDGRRAKDMLKNDDGPWPRLACIHRTGRPDGPDELFRCVYDADGPG